MLTYEKKPYTVMLNKWTNVNKTNNHLSSQIFDLSLGL